MMGKLDRKWLLVFMILAKSWTHIILYISLIYHEADFLILGVILLQEFQETVNSDIAYSITDSWTD